MMYPCILLGNNLPRTLVLNQDYHNGKVKFVLLTV